MAKKKITKNIGETETRQLEREKSIREDFKEMIAEWHKINPRYIFLNETSATPWGYLIKEAWRVAYPKERLPRFYRINPRGGLPGRGDKSNRVRIDKEFQDYLRRRIKDRRGKIIIFDETRSIGASIGRVKHALKTIIPAKKLYLFNGVGIIKGFDQDRHYDQHGRIYYDEDKSHYYLGNEQMVLPRIKVTEKVWGAGHYTGYTTKDPIMRKEALAYIQQLKQEGREIGKKIRKERGLEGKVVGFISISSLALSLLFLTSNFTGFVIANNTNVSNIAGVILFLVGIVGSFFYFKNKGFI